jgi:hypothetical protein
MRNEWSATTLFMTIQKLKQIARHLALSMAIGRRGRSQGGGRSR